MRQRKEPPQDAYWFASRPLIDDAEVRQFLKDATAGGLALVEAPFSATGSAQEKSPPTFPWPTRASQVLDLSRGLTMRAQLGVPRKTLVNDAQEAADLVLLPGARNNGPGFLKLDDGYDEQSAERSFQVDPIEGCYPPQSIAACWSKPQMV